MLIYQRGIPSFSKMEKNNEKSEHQIATTKQQQPLLGTWCVFLKTFALGHRKRSLETWIKHWWEPNICLFHRLSDYHRLSLFFITEYNQMWELWCPIPSCIPTWGIVESWKFYRHNDSQPTVHTSLELSTNSPLATSHLTPIAKQKSRSRRMGRTHAQNLFD